MSTREDIPTRHTVFVHDFTPVDAGFLASIDALEHVLTPEAIASLVLAAVRQEVGDSLQPCERPLVTLGQPRWRQDAVIIPMLWNFALSAGFPLEADIELAAYTASRSHLHLLGRIALPDHTEPSTPEASIFGRQAVAVVRHVLDDLARLLTLSTLATHSIDSTSTNNKALGGTQ